MKNYFVVKNISVIRQFHEHWSFPIFLGKYLDIILYVIHCFIKTKYLKNVT